MALENWPRQAGAERSARILAEVRRGNYQHSWCNMRVGELVLAVSCDALKIDGVRVNVDAITQQLIADMLGAVLLTPKLADEIYSRATKLSPRPQPISSSTQAMIDHSARVDAEIRRACGEMLGCFPADVGKDWVLVKSIFTQQARSAQKAANYSWHVPTQQYQGLRAERSVTGGFVIQGVGTAHGALHSDYSQIARFARRAALYGQDPVDLALVYTGKDPGTELVSHEGPLPDWRQPGSDDPSGFPSSEPPTKRSGLGPTILGGAAAGVLAVAAGAGGPLIAASVLIGGILAKKASA